MNRRLPSNVTLAVAALVKPYCPDLSEIDIAARLTAPPSDAPAAAPREVLLTVPAAARALGVCVATVGNMFRANELKRVKIRGATRVRLSEIDALATGRGADAQAGQ